MNVRFWTFINDGYVKLTLQPNSRLRWYSGGPTDEGWSSISEAWSYDIEAGVVFNEIDTDGVDCDGRLSTHDIYACDVEGITYQKDAPWHRINSRQRDYSAERMGY